MTMLADHRTVGIKLSPASYDALMQRAAADGRSLSALAKELVLSNLGIIETPKQHMLERMAMRSVVGRMTIEQRLDYRQLVTKGLRAAEAIEAVLGKGWRREA